MRLMLLLFVVLLLAAPAFAQEAAAKVATETGAGALDFLVDLLQQVRPDGGGPAVVATRSVTEGCEAAGIRLVTVYDRDGYLDLLATYSQEVRGAGLSFEPAADLNLAVGVCIWRDKPGLYASWHFDF